MKTIYTMLVDGFEMGTWKIGKIGSYFYRRRWRSLERVNRLALDFYFNNHEVVVQEWMNGEVVNNITYRD